MTNQERADLHRAIVVRIRDEYDSEGVANMLLDIMTNAQIVDLHAKVLKHFGEQYLGEQQ